MPEIVSKANSPRPRRQTQKPSSHRHSCSPPVWATSCSPPRGLLGGLLAANPYQDGDAVAHTRGLQDLKPVAHHPPSLREVGRWAARWWVTGNPDAWKRLKGSALEEKKGAGR